MKNLILIFSFILTFIACNTKTSEKIKINTDKLIPLFPKLEEPKPGDWLAHHNEKGQTYKTYLESNPVKVDSLRNKIYVLPLGDFNQEEMQILDSTISYMRLFFNLDVIKQKTLSTQSIPDTARRTASVYGKLDESEQILTTYILYNILLPKLPQDAIAYMAVTNKDLYPAPNWHFVFGQASTRKKVGVSSMFRLREFGEKGFQVTLRRFGATMTHETGHMLSIQHCTAYQCVMNGSNSLAESDRRHIHLCPECLAKVCWNVNVDVLERCKKLKKFYQNNGLENEMQFCDKSIQLLQ